MDTLYSQHSAGPHTLLTLACFFFLPATSSRMLRELKHRAAINSNIM